MPDRDLTSITSGRIAWTLSHMCSLVRVSRELGWITRRPSQHWPLCWLRRLLTSTSLRD